MQNIQWMQENMEEHILELNKQLLVNEIISFIKH